MLACRSGIPPPVSSPTPPTVSSLDFAGLEIAYDDRVLTPRPWTAMQSRWAAELCRTAPPGALLELCAGAGHIGLAAARLSDRDLVCVDVEPASAELTLRNARAAGLADRVEVRLMDLEEAVTDGEVFALVIADPPWVSTDRITRYPEDPTLAIDGGADGLDVARSCVDAAAGHLPAAGSLLLQLGDREQASSLARWAEQHGWSDAGVRQGEGGVVLRLRHP
jgi:release factor glutamine methyltransferase